MKMKLISHEVPLKLLKYSKKFNDYDYALVHLFPQSRDYYYFFEESLKEGRQVILDNSVFELGQAYDEFKYKAWIERLNPTYYIIPDVFGDSEATIANVHKWTEALPEHKCIGVIQGRNIKELVNCYREIAPYVDKIAISFAQPAFLELFKSFNRDEALMLGRIYLINYLLLNRFILREKPHHLLGCSLPQEFISYQHSNYDFIESVDTSSPIIHGIYGIPFTPYGIKEKCNVKVDDIFFEENIKNKQIIVNNIKMFKSYINENSI